MPEHYSLKGDVNALTDEVGKAHDHITELMDAQHEEVKQFNAGHDAFFAGVSNDDAPKFDVDYDVWTCGWAWGKFLKDEAK
jgi:hypothetical protein